MLVTALATLVLVAVQDTTEAPPHPLKIELKLDAEEYVIGAEAQAEVKLTNSGEKDLEMATLLFENRSVSFEISIVPGPEKTVVTFNHTVTAPDPHLVDRLPLAAITLKAGASATFRRRIPTLIPGRLTIFARYAGYSARIQSKPVTVDVNPRAEGTSRLAAIFNTSSGTFQATLAPGLAPNNVANFVTLARKGYYDDMIFHRVVKNGWIQSGCPYGNGYGGPGYTVKSEASAQVGPKGFHEKGTIAMSGHLKNEFSGSQFFVALGRVDSFDRKFTIIGRIPEKGMETVEKIGKGRTDRNTDRPTDDVKLIKVTIVVE